MCKSMYDTVIIGGGAAGLTAAIYAARAQLSAVTVEKMPIGAGQIAESERVDNYPGLYGKNGFELIEEFRAHALALGAELRNDSASGIVGLESGYSVELSDGSALKTRTIIYAAGASHRRLDVDGEARLTGKGVSYCAVCDGMFHRGETVAVVGGGDTALGEAITLSRIAQRVYLIHRRDEFRANMSLRDKVSQTPNIELIMSASPLEILGESRVSGIRLLQSGSERQLEVGGVFVAIGEQPESALLKGIAELDGGGYVIAGEDGATSAEGIFAAGDVRSKQLRQLLTAAADGANCVYSAERYLRQTPRK